MDDYVDWTEQEISFIIVKNSIKLNVKNPRTHFL